MNPYRLLKVLPCMGIILLVTTYLVIHWVWLPPERSFPAISFITYTNASNGKQYALVAVTNHDSCAITFHGYLHSYDGSNNGHWRPIQISLANKTMSPGSSCTAMLEVPPHTNLGMVSFGFHQTHSCAALLRLVFLSGQIRRGIQKRLVSQVKSADSFRHPRVNCFAAIGVCT
jgi:hypothetical protein